MVSSQILPVYDHWTREVKAEKGPFLPLTPDCCVFVLPKEWGGLMLTSLMEEVTAARLSTGQPACRCLFLGEQKIEFPSRPESS